MTALVRPGFNTSLPGASIIARARPLFWAPKACGTSYAGPRFLGKIFNYFHVFPTWRSHILTVLSGKCLSTPLFRVSCWTSAHSHWVGAFTRASCCGVRRRGPRPSWRIIPHSVLSYFGCPVLAGFHRVLSGFHRVLSGPGPSPSGPGPGPSGPGPSPSGPEIQ